MKILFAVQGTGNGHISRAREIMPILQRYGHVDMLISGSQSDVFLHHPPKYKLHGFSFIFGKKGSVDHWLTYKTMNLPRLLKDIRTLPVQQYDMVINDFEPVSAWACKWQGKPIIALSHQAAFLSTKTPRPSHRFHYAEWIFRYYAPAIHHIGFHFQAYDDFIHTPVIRSEIRNTEPQDMGHITVYLPAFHDQLLLPYFNQITDIRWEVFSKHCLQAYIQKNVSVQPINNHKFNQSMSKAFGVLTGGGFEGPAEALFLQKKVMMIPMYNQYEQLCNAEAARRLGVSVSRIDHNFLPTLRRWLSSPNDIKIDFPDETSEIIDNLIYSFR